MRLSSYHSGRQCTFYGRNCSAIALFCPRGFFSLFHHSAVSVLMLAKTTKMFPCSFRVGNRPSASSTLQHSFCLPACSKRAVSPDLSTITYVFTFPAPMRKYTSNTGRIVGMLSPEKPLRADSEEGKIFVAHLRVKS